MRCPVYRVLELISKINEQHKIQHFYSMYLFQVSSPRWIISCSWFMESVPCVTWGSGAWSNAVSTKHSNHSSVFVYPLWWLLWNKLVKSLCFQWMTSVACRWSCCRVTLRNLWMITPSAGWSSCLSSGTRLYMETPQGWTGEERQGPTGFESLGIINQT